MKTLLWLCPLLLLFLFLFAAPLSASQPFQAPACTTASPSSNPSVGPGPTVCLSITYNDPGQYTAIVVSWLSAASETGYVNLLGQGPIYDFRGQTFSGRTHFVEFLNLQPNTTYQFDVVSGDKTFNNGGQHWNFHTGATLAPSRAFGVIGAVKNADGSQADGAIVYVTIQRTTDQATSALLSQLITPEDVGFSVPLANARTALDGAKFSFDRARDMVIITAAGDGGFASTTVGINVALPPQPNPPNVSLMLGEGYVNVATATPTAIPPTSTWTPVTPSMTPTLIPATATVVAATQTAQSWTATPTATPIPPSPTRVIPTRTWTSVPTETEAPTVEETETETPTAEPTLVATDGTAEPTSIHIAPRPSATPGSRSFLGLAGVGLLALLAVGAFGGAVLLAIAAFVIWKR